MKKFFVPAFLCFSSLVYADKAPFAEPPHIEAPWLTGPLLAPSAIPIPGGHYYLEPYLYAVANTGAYNREWKAVQFEDVLWNIYTQPTLQFGITQWMDFQFNPTLFYNYHGGAAKWAIGDMPVGFDIQLYTRGKNPTDWITSIKLVLKEVIPMGKYRNLNPHKRGTDIGGQGSWNTQLGLVWGQLAHITGVHFFDTRLSFQYSLPAPVRVKGFNAYGGGFGTKGTVYPAQNLEVDLGMELTLTQNWVFAMDIVGTWSGRTRFKGRRGVDAKGLPASIGVGSGVQYALAPAVEYNWNANVGIIAGPWFTIGGRNSVQFASFVFAFSYYH